MSCHINRRSLPLSIGLTLLASLTLVACSGPNHPQRVGDATARSITTTLQGHAQVDDGVIQLRSRGMVDVVVDSVGGDVEVIGNPNVEMTTVEVVRQANHGYLRGTEPYEALGLIDWSADLTPGPGPVETLSVKTVYTGPEVWFIRTHIRIETPDLDRVRVRTKRGSVTVRNNTGPVDIQTSEGDALVATAHPLRDANKIIVYEGDVDYRVPGGSTGDFDVQVIDGQIKTRIIAGQWRFSETHTEGEMIQGVLNGGQNPVIIRTTDGDIRISVVSNPLGYGPIRSEA